MSDHIRQVRNNMISKNLEIDVDSFAEHLVQYLKEYDLKLIMGFHIAGYVDQRPKIRHVFHKVWHDRNEYTTEETNIESHSNKGVRIPHTPNEDYIEHLSLFNGDNAVVQNLILGLPAFHGRPYTIDHENMTLKDASELCKLASYCYN